MAGRITEELRKATRAQSGLHPVDEAVSSSADLDPEGAHGPFGWVALVVLVVLVLGGWLLVRRMQADSKMQDCIASGRKNCAPIDTDSMRGAPAPP